MFKPTNLKPAMADNMHPFPTVFRERVHIDHHAAPKRQSLRGRERILEQGYTSKHQGFSPDTIGSITIATASFALVGGIPFGAVGFGIGAVFGFTVAFFNQRKKLKRSDD